MFLIKFIGDGNILLVLRDYGVIAQVVVAVRLFGL